MGVYAFSATRFTILAEFGTEDLISIADGRAQIGQLQAGQSKTYVFRLVNDNDNVDIAMALTGGTSGTLVGYVNALQEASLDQSPSATDYTGPRTILMLVDEVAVSRFSPQMLV